MTEEQAQAEPEPVETDHLITLEELCDKYEASVNYTHPNLSKGLTEEEAATRLERNGPNALTPPVPESNIRKYFQKLLGLFNVFLIVAGVLAFILYFLDTSAVVNIYLGAILVFVAFANAAIEFYQEYKTSAILESFKGLVTQNCKVIRGGGILTVETTTVVLGDLVMLDLGDQIPADLRLVSCRDMKLDNSSITGESEPQERSLRNTATNILEATNMAFSGSKVMSGNGIGVVVRTGDHSMLGSIANLTLNSKKRVSQLTIETGVFVKRTAVVAFVVAVIFFIFGIVSDFGVGITFSFAIGTFVAFIPQGLPVTVTLVLTIAAKRLAERNVLVKDLQAVETLGSITVLATDKTGTLTQNKMTVVSVWINNAVHEAQPDKPEQQFVDPATANFAALLQVASLCGKSKFNPLDKEKPIGERELHGDATEVGIVRFACRYVDVQDEVDTHVRPFEIPFNSANKWHLTVVQAPHETGQYRMLIKGAPERIKSMCATIRDGDRAIPWNTERSSAFDTAYEGFASKGRRVLAFAQCKLPGDQYPEGFEFDAENIPMDQFEFLALTGLMDPPKHGVRKAILALRSARIQVIMVTGDHPLTAESIARSIMLINNPTKRDAAEQLKKPIELVGEDEYDAVVVHGDEIDTWGDADWDRVLSKQDIVFARTSPKHKLEIVTRLQAKGHIVGVSGDGVNDSPALKKADLGISMNKSASEVSKAAAAMILLDDNFPTIVNGIYEGRLVFANLKKSIRYTLTHIMPEVIAFITFIIFAIPAPISSILVLMVDLGSELGPAISYAYELAEGDLMLVPPRKVLVKATEVKPGKKHWWSRKAKTAADAEMGQIEPAEDVIATPLPLEQPTVADEAEKSGVSKMSVRWQRLLDHFRIKGSGEMLVDREMIIWCYFQGGIIETIGCMASYLVVLWVQHAPFDNLYKSALTYWQDGAPPLTLSNGTIADADAQVRINNQAQAAYYVTLVMIQWVNIFICKHRYEYPWGWDLFKNWHTYAGIAASAAVAAFVIYVPGVNNIIFQTAPAPIYAYIAPVAGGLLLWTYEVCRRFLRKRGYFGGIPKVNENLVLLIRTTSSMH